MHKDVLVLGIHIWWLNVNSKGVRRQIDTSFDNNMIIALKEITTE